MVGIDTEPQFARSVAQPDRPKSRASEKNAPAHRLESAEPDEEIRLGWAAITIMLKEECLRIDRWRY